MTTEVYGHLAPGYLRDEVDRLRFNVPAPDPKTLRQAANAPPVAAPFAAPVLQDPPSTPKSVRDDVQNASSDAHMRSRARQDSNLRPTAPEAVALSS